MSAHTFESFFACEYARLVSRLIGMTHNRDLAEELASSALAIAYARRAQFRGQSSLSTWINTIAYHEWCRHQTRASQTLCHWQDDETLEQIPVVENVDDRLDRSECCARIRALLRRLPRSQRYALTAHIVRGIPVRQIARQQRVPLGTVLSRIHKAKSLLKRYWRP